MEQVSQSPVDGFIGETDLFRIHLFYQPDREEVIRLPINLINEVPD